MSARRALVSPLTLAPAGAAAVAVAAQLLVVRGLGGALDPGIIPSWSLVVAFFGAELYAVTVARQFEVVALAPHDAVLVLGFFLVRPADLVPAQVAGAALALLLLGRMPVRGAATRLGVLALSSSLALVCFHLLRTALPSANVAGWLAAFVGAATASGSVVLLSSGAGRVGVLRRSGDTPGRVAALALAGSVSSASLALAAVELMRSGAGAAGLLALPFVACALALRAYAYERRRLEHLRALYDSMRTVGRAPGIEAGVAELLAAARTLLDAAVARIVLVPRGRSGSPLLATIGRSGETVLEPARLSPAEEAATTLAAKSAGGYLATASRGPHGLRALVRELELHEAMLAPLRGDDGLIGVLLVGDRAGSDPFTVADLHLLETFASHAGVLLENDQLEQSLAELQTLRDQLRHQAHHDALTGLPNRRLFTEHVTLALAEGPAPSVAVLFLDLDDFKMINDSLGHGAGDALLEAVAGRVRAAVRLGDVPARLGGDEFAVLARRAEPAEADEIAGRLVEALDAPFAIDGREISVHASVGIAYGGRGAATADELLRNADVAMYDAKQTGKRRFAVYAPEMHAAVRRRQELAGALERAVERGEIGVHFQPIVDLETRRLVALEALARWDRPEHGLLLPDSFIGLADEIGMMVEIGSAVLRAACRQAIAWQSAFPGHDGLVVNVNLAPSELHDAGLADAVRSVLVETGLPPERLTLEITESGVMRNPEQALATMRELRALGVSLALDDFGTGHSSLAHLREFPLDSLKIARPFVAGLPDGHVDRVFVDAIVRLASSLGLDVVAEGIEREAQADVVSALGCTHGQGYYFGSPLAQLGIAGYLAAGTLPEQRPTLSRVA